MKLAKSGTVTQSFKYLLSASTVTTVLTSMVLQIDADMTIDIVGVTASFDLSGTPYSFPCSSSAFLTEQSGTLTITVPSISAGYTVYPTIAYGGTYIDSKLGDRTLFGRLGQREYILLGDPLPVFEIFSALGEVAVTEFGPFSPYPGVFT